MSGVNIDWRLGVMPNVGGNALAAFEQGQKMGQEFRRQRVLADYASDPSNPKTINALLAAAPDVGFRALEHQRKVAADEREMEGQNALADYVAASMGRAGQAQQPPNALLHGNSPRPMAGNVTAPHEVAAPPSPQGVPPSPQGMSPPTLPDSTNQPELPGPQPSMPGAGAPEQAGPHFDLSALGKPQTRNDHLFLRALRSSPKEALQIDSLLRDNMVKNLAAERDVYDFAVSRLAGVTDQAGYDAVLADVDRYLRPLGGNVREMVPAQYPGPEGIAQLRQRALTSKDQIAAFLQESNVEADNERADRNTDSLIEDREARTGIARTRANEYRQNNVRRDATTRRGQDRRGSGGKDAGAASAPTPTATGANGEKYVLKGGKWVRTN